ncbi:MAG: MOFRL family protein, partial [Candidatus Bathyarchaeia archaeon]
TILTSMLQGEASQVGIFLASIAREIEAHNSPLAKPAAIVMGGESTVTVRGSGAGGRNQELSLSVGLAISGLEGTAFASMGTDGIDGQTNAAGAIVDGKTVSRALRLKLTASDYLRRNDSHSFFAQLGDLILTGPTGTNVNDISVAVLI